MNLKRYRIDTEGKYYFHTFKQDQNFNTKVWLENKGQFETKEHDIYATHYSADDIYATYYNADGTINWTEENKDRRTKEQKLEDIIANANQVEYDAHSQAIDNLGSSVTLANFEFIKALVVAMPELQPVYDAIYKTTTGWKGYDNKTHIVQFESLAEALKDAMTKRAQVYGV